MNRQAFASLFGSLYHLLMPDGWGMMIAGMYSISMQPGPEVLLVSVPLCSTVGAGESGGSQVSRNDAFEPMARTHRLSPLCRASNRAN